MCNILCKCTCKSSGYLLSQLRSSIEDLSHPTKAVSVTLIHEQKTYISEKVCVYQPVHTEKHVPKSFAPTLQCVQFSQALGWCLTRHKIAHL